VKIPDTRQERLTSATLSQPSATLS